MHTPTLTVEEINELLDLMGFSEKSDNVREKTFKDGATIKLDFKDKTIIYPKGLKVNDTTTSNHGKAENFVVLECINRLLTKGYRPEHIELEKRWNLGHDPKGGKSDICVSDENGDMLLIIECKTYGAEYTKEKKNLLADGGQLFSYWQQEGSTKWLALYASCVKDGEIIYENEIINCADDGNIKELAKKGDTNTKLFENAKTAKEKFDVWSETYNKVLYRELIFGEDTVAYQIGVKPLRKKHLRDFTSEDEDKIVASFAEILRHNSVSDKENAFNRLTSLFICKLADELGKTEDAPLDFHYMPMSDKYDTLQVRLQELYYQGMTHFMKEDIFYVEDKYAERLVNDYSGQNREAMIAELQKTIRSLKFYTNNDFTFKDVHNEELFYQNGKILVEVVQLFENYRIVDPTNYKILGHLFEKLLNKGFKQDEGQFFTPPPITRFIWDSLPLDRIVFDSGKFKLPKIIDYACGAGHFLTAAVEAVNAALIRHGQDDLAKSNAWVRDGIFGIEKDYRLARVSKISLFMNGAGNGNIVFGDGLDNYPEKQIKAGDFDILVANPPYSVDAFKLYLKLKNNSLKLVDNITNVGSAIQLLFVERIAQLLKPGGIAAVILPSSILSNSSTSHIAARENLLENFKIHAIAQFGSKTFGATNTSTVVLFLEKYAEPPKRKDQVADSVAAIQAGYDLTDWEDDMEILQKYLAKIKVSEEDYRAFLKGDMSLDYWKAHPYFGRFVAKDEENADVFYKSVRKVEQDKLKFFALVYKQKTLVITSPDENNAQKEFLGYTWSTRKNDEGIQITREGGKCLYNNDDRIADGTIAAAIRRAFSGLYKSDAELEKYLAWHSLHDMINFTKKTFNKEIRTSILKKPVVSSKYPEVNLEFIAAIEKGQSITQADTAPGKIKVVAGGIDYAYMHNAANRDAGVITVSSSGANAGFVNFWDEPIFASDCITIVGKSKTETLFIYYYLKTIQDYIFSLALGAAQPHVYSDDLGQIEIPIPSLDIQKQIVDECGKIDAGIASLKDDISSYQKNILTIYGDAQNKASASYRLDDEAVFEALIGERVLNSELIKDGKIPVYSANVNTPFGYMDKSCVNDFSHPAVLWGIDGDWMTSYMPADVIFNPTDHCGVVRILTDEISAKYFSLALYETGKLEKFSRTLRASIERITALTVKLPGIDVQKAAVEQIVKLERQIADARQILDAAAEKRQAILNKYLQ